jgi:hypothetical protein
MCTSPINGVSRRFTQDIIAMQDELSYRRLIDHLPVADLPHLAVRGDGLVTVGVRTEQLPYRYVLGMQGFRLAQYLKLGWACEQTAHGSALFCEPVCALHPDDVHIMTLNGQTGRILGYVSLTTSGDPQPRHPMAADRARFPVEMAHGINVFDHVPALDGVLTNQVRELKRFVHSRTLTDKAQRLRVTLELLLGAGRALTRIEPTVRTVVGDVEEKVALRHLLLAGLDVQLIEQTRPHLPNTDLLHLAYTRRGEVKPFVAHIPNADELQQRIGLLEATLSSPDLFQATDSFSDAVRGTTRRVAA